MGKLTDAMGEAVRAKLTPKQAEIHKTTKGRVGFLLGKEGGKVAQRLGVSATAVRRYLKGDRKNPPADIAKKIEAEVRKDWKPGLQKQAAKAARQRPVTVNTRAAFGYKASATGTTTPDGRLRNFRKTLPAEYADRLLEAQEVGDEAAAREGSPSTSRRSTSGRAATAAPARSRSPSPTSPTSWPTCPSGTPPRPLARHPGVPVHRHVSRRAPRLCRRCPQRPDGGVSGARAPMTTTFASVSDGGT
ncbi:telomere-protecting terminal protein Tpg [Kitasatospora sp. NPDC059327]|uniref:telomere-protecting terminal protein Tpg n=1 Tax=Kitasatospora sp. NPDC059327 TaxID=3346803 RepID=UPI0036B15D7E